MYDFALGGSAYFNCFAIRSGESQTVGTRPVPYAVLPPPESPLLRKLSIVIEERLNFPLAERRHLSCPLLHGHQFVVPLPMHLANSKSSHNLEPNQLTCDP